MASKFNHHCFPAQKVFIKSADHLSETFFNHHLLITMGPLPNHVWLVIHILACWAESWTAAATGLWVIVNLLPRRCAILKSLHETMSWRPEVRQGPMAIKKMVIKKCLWEMISRSSHHLLCGKKVVICWVLVSEPEILKGLHHFPGNWIFLQEMKPRKNIVY